MKKEGAGGVGKGEMKGAKRKADVDGGGDGMEVDAAVPEKPLSRKEMNRWAKKARMEAARERKEGEDGGMEEGSGGTAAAPVNT